MRQIIAFLVVIAAIGFSIQRANGARDEAVRVTIRSTRVVATVSCVRQNQVRETLREDQYRRVRPMVAALRRTGALKANEASVLLRWSERVVARLGDADCGAVAQQIKAG